MGEKTMDVRLTVCRAGPESAHVSGDVITLPVSEAKALLNAGQAEAVKRSAPERTEKRVTPTRETR